MVLGSPCICIRITGTCREAAISRAPSNLNALISFQIWAPAFTASCITIGCEVSIEIMTSKFLEMASTAGITRFNSSSKGTALAPGLVDSPPISMMVAPCFTIKVACSKALST